MIKAGLVTIAVLAGLVWAGLCCVILGYRINLSESMPYGIWREASFDGNAKPGDVVGLCLQASELIKRHIPPKYLGVCHNGLEPVLKPISAVAGDEVKLDSSGAWVNGEHLPNTAPLEYDSQDRPLEPWPFGTYTVEPGRVWLFSTWSKNSFDSRYFGPVNVDTIIARAIPVWVWK